MKLLVSEYYEHDKYVYENLLDGVVVRVNDCELFIDTVDIY